MSIYKFEQERAAHVNSRKLEKRPDWKEYIDTVLLGSGFVTMASFHGVADGKVWASSSGFSVSQDEAKFLIEGFTDPRELRKYGIFLGGITYTCTSVRPNYILGRRGNTGCVVYLCNKVLIIGVYGSDILPGGCLNIVLKLGDYLKDSSL